MLKCPNIALNNRFHSWVIKNNWKSARLTVFSDSGVGLSFCLCYYKSCQLTGCAVISLPASGKHLSRDAPQHVGGSARTAVLLSHFPFIKDRAHSLHWGTVGFLLFSWGKVGLFRKSCKLNGSIKSFLRAPLKSDVCFYLVSCRITTLQMDCILCSVWPRKENQRILFSADLWVRTILNNGLIM